MDPVAVVLVLAAVALTVLVISWPLRGNVRERDDAALEARITDLELGKEARYREIREAEMDFRTGKLSEADWKAIDRQLRAEAIELLRRLDELGVPPASEAAPPRHDTRAEAPEHAPAVGPSVDVPGA
jgi:hypothetical protein